MEGKSGEVLDFWLEIGPEKWFRRDDGTDAQIAERFGALIDPAIAGELDPWRAEARSCLALILVLDQFTRNIFRNDPRAFSGDPHALSVAAQALAAGYDRAVDPALRAFFYMPFMHSESIADQNRCVSLMHALGAAENLKYAIVHRDIIARFGRFPHRNPVLGRHTTPAERAYLDNGGFSA